MTRRSRNDIRLTLHAGDLRAFTHTVRLLMQHTDPTDKRAHAAYRMLHQLDRASARHKAKAGKRGTKNIDDNDQDQRSDDSQGSQAHTTAPDHDDKGPGRKAADASQ